MKITRIKASVLTMMAIFLVAACSNNDDDNSDNLQNQVQSNMLNGSWRITQFVDANIDETNQFSAYTFTFNADGTVLAADGANNYEGTWSVTDSNSGDGSMDDLDFNLFFNLTNDFEDLNDDWDIISQSDVKIDLMDISGGNGGTDMLTFERN